MQNVKLPIGTETESGYKRQNANINCIKLAKYIHWETYVASNELYFFTGSPFGENRSLSKTVTSSTSSLRS